MKKSELVDFLNSINEDIEIVFAFDTVNDCDLKVYNIVSAYHVDGENEDGDDEEFVVLFSPSESKQKKSKTNKTKA